MPRSSRNVEPCGNVRIRPHARLAGAVDGYDIYRIVGRQASLRREAPHGGGVLIFNLGEPIEVTGGDGRELRLRAGEGFFAGAHLRPAFSWDGGSQAGVHVRLPLATLRRLIGAPMHAFVDRVVPLDAWLGSRARDLGEALCGARTGEARAALLDSALGASAEARGALDPSQSFALRLLAHRPDLDIAAVASEIGWSRKHLADRVRDAVGVGPRCWRRLLRMQSLLAAIPGGKPDWPDLALGAGYCDQSHMIREFREFCGVSPTAYWRERSQARDHAAA